MSLKLNNKGAVAILTVVIVSAAALLIAYSASFLGLGELEMGYSHGQGKENLSFTEGCVEEALERLRKDDIYTGSTLNESDFSCIISVSGAGLTKTINVVGSMGEYTKRLEVQVDLSASPLVITSWQEN